MTKHFLLLLCLAVVPTQVWGQGVAFFQNDVTELPGGGTYQGTMDVELRAATPTESQGENPEISVDQFDGGFQTQGAIRFENLLVSEGGLVPEELSSDQILFAEFRLWKSSPSQSNANIEFSRVLRPDATSGDWWQEDDTWSSLGGDLIPNNQGLLMGDPINRSPDFNNGIIEATRREDNDPADFQDTGDRFGPDDMVVLVPADGPVPASMIYTTDTDSEDVFDLAWDGSPEDLTRAIDLAYWRFDVTEAVRGWLADTDPSTPGTQALNPDNYGWAINNDTGDGWDFVASEIDELPESDFDQLVDPENGVTELDVAKRFRPALTIIFDDGSAGPADIDKDGDVDLEDFDLFADLIAGELDGPLNTGAPGDLDFNRQIDLNDFKVFQQEFNEFNSMGLSTALASRASVPEPSAIVMVTIMLGGIIAARTSFRR